MCPLCSPGRRASPLRAHRDGLLDGDSGGSCTALTNLSDDFRRVTDANLRKIKSVLTMVGGKVVHQGPRSNTLRLGWNSSTRLDCNATSNRWSAAVLAAGFVSLDTNRGESCRASLACHH